MAQVAEIQIRLPQSTLMMAKSSHAASLNSKTNAMWKAAVGGLVIIAVASIGLSALWISRDRELDRLHSIPDRVSPPNSAEHIKLGVIGDSWVTGRKLDLAISEVIEPVSSTVEIVSSGHPGAKSRQIYRNLSDASLSAPHSSHHLLMDDELDFLVIVAGVNDTVGHVEAEFYAHHIWLIINTALARAITPVVVEIPEYGIEDTPAVGLMSWAKRTLYLWMNDRGMINVISDHRRVPKAKIGPEITDKIVFVDFTRVADDYVRNRSLYADPAHLYRKGFDALGRLIGQSIRESIIRAK